MADMFQRTIQLFTGDPMGPRLPKNPLKNFTERDLLRMESAIGRHLFGPIPTGHQREFFCLDARTWIWYERWFDPQTQEPQERTTRYEVHANGIIKIQEGQAYRVLEGEELINLQAAVKAYHEKVVRDIYMREPSLATS